MRLPNGRNRLLHGEQRELQGPSALVTALFRGAAVSIEEKVLAPRGSAATQRLDFLRTGYRELEVEFDSHDKAVWCYMRPKGPPSFTRSLLGELIGLRRAIQRDFAALPPSRDMPMRYFIGASRLPGLYNLGGDLTFFANCIKRGDRKALEDYAFDCVDVGYHMAVAFELPVITIALVQGDALGGI